MPERNDFLHLERGITRCRVLCETTDEIPKGKKPGVIWQINNKGSDMWKETRKLMIFWYRKKKKRYNVTN